MKKLLNLQTSPALCVLIEVAIPAIATLIIWIIIYFFLQTIAREHTSTVVSLGPGAVIVAANRRRIARKMRVVKDIVFGKR
jgi:hypothetical protein